MLKPIRIQLLGGLGNQLHCYVAAYVIARETARPVILDGRWLSWTGSNGYRSCSIQKISLSKKFKPKVIKSIWAIKRGPIRRRISSILGQIDRHHFSKGLDSNKFESVEELLETLRNDPKIDSISGHFASWDWAEKAKTFKDYQWDISDICQSTKAISNRASEAIGIHIRLGDYLHHPDIYPIISEEYFAQAINRLRSNKQEPYWIYTDDKSNLMKRYPKIVSGSQEIYGSKEMPEMDAFFLLSSHRKLVISNSTFSSWAAHVSEITNSVEIVCPAEYLIGEFKDSRPRNWIRMPINP